MYALIIYLDQTKLKAANPSKTSRYAPFQIARTLRKHGFIHWQGAIYFSGEAANKAACVAAVKDLADKYQWFQRSVAELRMLRITENVDLRTVL